MEKDFRQNLVMGLGLGSHLLAVVMLLLIAGEALQVDFTFHRYNLRSLLKSRRPRHTRWDWPGYRPK